jgi:hypothetical protein
VPALLTFKDLNIQPVSLPLEARQPERRAWVIETHLAAAQKKVDAAEVPIPQMRRALAAALRQEADLLAPADPGNASAPTPVPDAQSMSRDNARRAVDEAGAASIAESSPVSERRNSSV